MLVAKNSRKRSEAGARRTVTSSFMGSSDRVVRPRGFPALAPHQAIERLQVGALAPFGEEGRRVHRCQLLGHGRGDELVDADAVFLGAALDLRLDRTRQPQRVGAGLFHVLILRMASAGVSSSMPNRAGATPKSRRLKVTIAAAWPLTAASSTSSSAGSRSCGRHMKCVSTGSAIASTPRTKTPASGRSK